MTDFQFAGATAPRIPRHDRSTLVVAALLHAVLFAAIVGIKTHPRRVSSAGAVMQSGVAAYVPGPAGVMPATIAAPKPKPAPERKTALKTEVAKNTQGEDRSDAAQQVGTAGTVGAVQQGPVRLGGSGGNATLIKKVQPIYPAVMQAARMPGTVVLDAIINPDGTIGDVTVLKSSNEAFSQSAIAAVKQWRYNAIGFQGILTVTVNFMLTG